MRTLPSLLLVSTLLAAMVTLGVLPNSTVAEVAEPPEVVVVDRGEEPRQLLRYDPTEGQTGDFTFDFDVDMRMTMQGTTTPWFDSPALTVSGTSTVVVVHDDGTYEVESVITDVSVLDEGDPELVEELRAEMPSMVGMTVRSRLDDRGRLREVETSMPTGATVSQVPLVPDQFDAMALQQTQPVPEGPVGEGAVWEVTSTDAAAGFEAITTTTTTLDGLALDGSFTVSGRLRMSAEPQEMSLPDMPDYVDATLDEFEGDGSYRWEIDPTRPVITTEGDVSTTVAVTVSALDEIESIETEMRMRIGLEPAAEQ